MLGACQYRAELHKIIHPPLEEWIQRNAGTEVDCIFVYYHNREKTFVVGWWVNKSAGLFVDLFNMGYALSNFDSSDAQSLIRTLRDTSQRDRLISDLTTSEEDYIRQQQAEADVATDEGHFNQSTRTLVSVP